jgi:hypothetical protein
MPGEDPYDGKKVKKTIKSTEEQKCIAVKKNNCDRRAGGATRCLQLNSNHTDKLVLLLKIGEWSVNYLINVSFN